LVFLPFLPLSVIAIIAIGTGFLMLTPLLLFVIHTNELSKDFSFLKSCFSKKIIIGISVFGFLSIPAIITVNYLKDKSVLNKTLEYLYTPDYSKQYSIDKKSLQKTLKIIKSHKDNNSGGIFGSQQPYLSSYFNWLVLNNLTLSNPKINYIEQVFFGVTPAKQRQDEIRNENAIRVLIKKLAESVMQPSSLSRIKNIVDSTGTTISRNTLTDYLQLLADAYLVFGISNFSDKLSDKETFKKRYFFDNGLLNNFLFDPETKLLENLVAIDLKKKYGDDLFFYNKNVEVDFFVPKERRAIQVSYNMVNDVTRQREISALLKLSEVYSLDRLEIVTLDEELTLQENGATIRIIPAWKWLLKI